MQMNNIFLALGKHSKNDSSTETQPVTNKQTSKQTNKQTIWSLEYNTIQYNTIQYNTDINTIQLKRR